MVADWLKYGSGRDLVNVSTNILFNFRDIGTFFTILNRGITFIFTFLRFHAWCDYQSSHLPQFYYEKQPHDQAPALFQIGNCPSSIARFLLEIRTYLPV